jgi:outer membrane lipoprotein carrier protein
MRTVLSFIIFTSFILAGITLPQNFTSDFTQKVTTPKGKVVTYRGKVAFSNTNTLKWIYSVPTFKEVCSSPDALVIVEHDLEQVTTYRLFNKRIDIVKLLQEAKPYKEHIFTTTVEEVTYTIQLTKAQKLHSIAYFDDMDNKVQIVFNTIKYNAPTFSTKLLECSVPSHYDKL